MPTIGPTRDQSCRALLVQDFEAAELPGRLGPPHVNGGHASVWLRRAIPLDAFLDRGPLALEDRLDASIPTVHHVAVQPEFPSPVRAVRAEVHPLHASMEDCDSTGLHDDEKRTIPK